MSERFNVVQFFSNGMHEYVRRNIPAKEAVETAKAYTESVGAQVGTTVRVIITDGGDNTNFEWKRGEGITFPTREQRETPTPWRTRP